MNINEWKQHILNKFSTKSGSLDALLKQLETFNHQLLNKQNSHQIQADAATILLLLLEIFDQQQWDLEKALLNASNQNHEQGKKIALIGTSASPITNGHLTMGLEILALTDVDNLWYYLVGKHPWGKKLMPAEHRLQMARLATARYPKLGVSDFEMVHGERIYKESMETAILLRNYFLPAYPQHKFCWVMGSDVAQTFHEWEGSTWMAEAMDIYVIHRLGYDFDKENSILKEPRHLYFKDEIVTSNISSTLVRERGKSYNQEMVLALVPEVVWAYLKQYQLLDPSILKT